LTGRIRFDQSPLAATVDTQVDSGEAQTHPTKKVQELGLHVGRHVDDLPL
jgi:hypothetical protein